jgi:hypothetical protein
MNQKEGPDIRILRYTGGGDSGIKIRVKGVGKFKIALCNNSRGRINGVRGIIPIGEKKGK